MRFSKGQVRNIVAEQVALADEEVANLRKEVIRQTDIGTIKTIAALLIGLVYGAFLHYLGYGVK